MTTEVQRQAIKDNVEAGEDRMRARHEATPLDRAGETAIEAKDRFTAFAREHPVTTVAAGLAIGVLISGLFPRSPTRRAGAKVAGLAGVGAEAALSYLHQALEAVSEAGRAGAEQVEDWGDSLGDSARQLSRDAGSMARGASASLKRQAAYAADSATDTARISSRATRKGLRRMLRRTT